MGDNETETENCRSVSLSLSVTLRHAPNLPAFVPSPPAPLSPLLVWISRASMPAVTTCAPGLTHAAAQANQAAIQHAEETGEAERARQEQNARAAEAEAQAQARFEEKKARWKEMQAQKRLAAKQQRAAERAAAAAAAAAAGGGETAQATA